MTRHPGADMYDQGLATIVLCEAFAMTQDENLRGPAQACLNFVVAAQDPFRGGWWYQPSRGERSALWAAIGEAAEG